MLPSLTNAQNEPGGMVLRIANPISSVQLVSVTEHDVARINSISKKYKQERQESKAPTFALTR